MRRHLILAATLGALALTLSGCIKEYDTKDAVDLIRENYGFKPRTQDDGVDFEDEEGYTDTLWTMVDAANDVTFHVLDDHYWGMESAANSLRTDYLDCLFLAKAPAVDGLTYEERTWNNVLTNVLVEGAFTNRAELAQLHEALCTLQAEVADLADGAVVEDTSYWLSYEHPLCDVDADHPITDGDIGGTLDDITADNLQELEEEYLLCAIAYQFEDALAEFSEEEITAAVAGNKDIRHIGRLSETPGGEVTWYPDLCTRPYSRDVTYGVLYEILRREGIAVEGTAWHYSFTGVDATYEISYDYYDDGYYYLRDGERVSMRSSFYNYFNMDEIAEMTGLSLVVTRNPEDYVDERVTENSDAAASEEPSTTESPVENAPTTEATPDDPFAPIDV